jgi:hypothetical protein
VIDVILGNQLIHRCQVALVDLFVKTADEGLFASADITHLLVRALAYTFAGRARLLGASSDWPDFDSFVNASRLGISPP